MSDTNQIYSELTGNRIYEQHAKAFSEVSAYVVTDATGERVATVAFQFSKSGLRTTCWLHIIGFPMVKKFASGGGYDKASAAAHRAAQAVTFRGGETEYERRRFDRTKRLVEAIKDTGNGWSRDLRDAGFNVLQAV